MGSSTKKLPGNTGAPRWGASWEMLSKVEGEGNDAEEALAGQV